MKGILEVLSKASGQYEGEGTNHEQQPFIGKIALAPILNGRGFAIRFSATGKDGTLDHQEESTIAPSIQEKLTLWNFNTNNPSLIAHDLRATELRRGAAHTFAFGFGEPSNTKTFREEIAIDVWNNGDLSYTYSWGLPGGEFKERSGVRMSPTRKQGQLEKLDPIALTQNVTEEWKNFVVSEVDDHVVRLAVVQNDFHWHHHAKGDEMFYVISGKFFIDLEGRTEELKPGEIFTVPKMTRHKTRANERTVVMCFESRENDIMGSR